MHVNDLTNETVSVIRQADHNGKKTTKIIVVSIVSTGTVMLVLGITFYIWKKKKKPKREGNPRISHFDSSASNVCGRVCVCIYAFFELQTASTFTLKS